MYSGTTYTDSEWKSNDPSNGQSGIGLTEIFIRVIERLSHVRTICDLGCGNGYMAGRLAALGYQVTGVDASQSGLAIARLNYPKVRFVEALIDARISETTGLREFDLVLSSDVIEHLYRPADLLEAAASVIKPSGHFVVGTPYHGYLKNIALSLSGRMDSHFCALDDGGHIKFFSVKTLSSLMQEYGFADLHFNFYGRAPWLWKNMICRARQKG